jgi:hypothetical protein
MTESISTLRGVELIIEPEMHHDGAAVDQDGRAFGRTLQPSPSVLRGIRLLPAAGR